MKKKKAITNNDDEQQGGGKKKGNSLADEIAAVAGKKVVGDDEDDDDNGFAPPIPAPRLGSMDPSLSTVASSFSGAAAQSLRDDTIFGSKIGANPFTRAGSASASSNPAGTSASGGGPTMPNFRPLGNIEDMGTVYDAHALAGQDKSNTWSAESPSKSRQS